MKVMFKRKFKSKNKKPGKIGKQADVSDVQITLLKNAVASTIGPDVVGIVELLSGRKNVNEFTIAEKLKLTINQTRNILYKLSDEGLVSFVRKKDKKNGGWYTYFWTLETGKSFESLKKVLGDKIEALEKELEKRKQERFYYCKNCDLEYNEEDALHALFVCAECGDVLELKDNDKFIDEASSELEKFRKDLAVINEEVEKLAKKSDEALVRKIKKEEKNKKIERAVRRKEREKEKAKLKKKEEKLNPKTKVKVLKTKKKAKGIKKTPKKTKKRGK